MPTILLIRHGENDYVKKGRLAGRLPGVHLNHNGTKQAEIVADLLSGAPIKSVYSSPLERCMETAQPLADKLNLTVIPREGLLEVDFGNWQDKTLKQLRRRKLWKAVQNNPARTHFPEGESFAIAQNRIINELETLCKKHKSKDLIACYSHSDVIRLAIAYYIGTPLDLFQRILISPGSISTLHLGDFTVQVLNVNQRNLNAFVH
jgi:probable phosphoglycerate mutase